MKKLLSLSTISFFALCIFASSLFVSSAFATTSIRTEVNGMVCAFCAKGISKKLGNLPQTKEVYVDLKSKVVAIELKDAQTLSLEKVTKIIKDAGYEVTKSEYLEKSISEIKSELASAGAKP